MDIDVHMLDGAIRTCVDMSSAAFLAALLSYVASTAAIAR